MKPTLLITILIVLATHSYAQKQNDTKDFQTTYWAPKWRITELINPLNPSIQFGLEKRINKYGFELQLGYTIPKENMSVDSAQVVYEHTEGFSIRADGRRYLKDFIDKNGSAFVGVQLFYTYYTTPHRRRHYYTHFVYYSYNMPVHTYGLALTIGYQKRLFKNLLIECHLGAGLKRKVLVDHETEGGDLIGYIPELPILVNNEYSYTTVAMPVSVAIGYIF